MRDPDQLPSVYLDSMLFIYAREGDADTAPPARELFGYLSDNPGLGLTSELTLAEVFAPTTRRGRLPPQLKRAYLNLIVWRRFIKLEPVSRPVLCETADLRFVARMKLPDAIHLVTAIRMGCGYFVSADAGITTPRGVTKVLPDASGIAGLIEELA